MIPFEKTGPVTRAELEERLALAKQYGPECVLNLAAEFRRRNGWDYRAPSLPADWTDLSKCGLEAPAGEAALDIGGDGRLSKRLRPSRTLTSTETANGKTTITVLSGPLEKMRIAIDAENNHHLEDLDKLEAQLTTIQSQVEKYPHLKAALESGGAEIRANHLGNLEIHVHHKHAWPHEASAGVAKSYRPTSAEAIRDDEPLSDSAGF
jgi:hypothetical protein